MVEVSVEVKEGACDTMATVDETPGGDESIPLGTEKPRERWGERD